MNKLTEHQIVAHNGIPVAAVIPYEDYLRLLDGEHDDEQDYIPTDAELESVRADTDTIPHEVMALIIKRRLTPLRAWREYLGLTQDEVAERMGIKQPSYARMENRQVAPRLATLKKVAAAMGIHYSQLDLEVDE